MKKETAMTICKRFRHVYQTGDLYDIAPESVIEPQYYNAGMLGWNCDLYVDYASDTIITNGYRNTRGAKIPRDLLDKYAKRAAHIRNEYLLGKIDNLQDAYYENLHAFIQELNAR